MPNKHDCIQQGEIDKLREFKHKMRTGLQKETVINELQQESIEAIKKEVHEINVSIHDGDKERIHIVDEIKNVHESLKNGFSEIHLKQDYTNGKVKSNTTHREKTEDFIKDLQDERKMVRKKFITEGIDLLFKVAIIIAGAYLTLK